MPHMLQSLHEGGGVTECSGGMRQILYPQPRTETICEAICSQSLHEGERAKKDSRTAAHNLTARKDEQGAAYGTARRHLF